MNQTLKLQYEKIKKVYSYINLSQRENLIVRLTKDKEKTILWQYLYEEVKPLLEQFRPEDAEIVREYFRSIYKTVLGDTNLIKSGFKIVKR